MPEAIPQNIWSQASRCLEVRTPQNNIFVSERKKKTPSKVSFPNVCFEAERLRKRIRKQSTMFYQEITGRLKSHTDDCAVVELIGGLLEVRGEHRFACDLEFTQRRALQVKHVNSSGVRADEHVLRKAVMNLDTSNATGKPLPCYVLHAVAMTQVECQRPQKKNIHLHFMNNPYPQVAEEAFESQLATCPFDKYNRPRCAPWNVTTAVWRKYIVKCDQEYHISADHWKVTYACCPFPPLQKQYWM